jgi:glycine betaine/proline transport system ATP-binding protein
MVIDTIHTNDNLRSTVHENQSRISIKSLWKVFGKNPERVFEEPYINNSRTEIQKETGLVTALRDVSFEVIPGETFVVMGLSGSGKSTLVRCLIGLIKATSGEIVVDGDDITNFNSKELREFRRSKMALVFQNFGLLPHKNVLDNAAYGLEVKGVGKEERYLVAREMLNKVGLTGWENANQRELSGGMQQRVGLARALAVDPSILLMDEPFSGLDPLIRRQMREELSLLQSEIQKTIIFITHDLDEAITIGDRIAIMRDGQIIQIGTPKEIITHPADDFVKEFTQGIPKTKVIDIENVTSEPDVIFSPSDSHEIVRAKMDQANTDYAIGVDHEEKYLGVLCRDQLDAVFGSAVDICSLIDSTIPSVYPGTTLDKALSFLSDQNLPIPVVDESNSFIGVATQTDLLKVVANGL